MIHSTEHRIGDYINPEMLLTQIVVTRKEEDYEKGIQRMSLIFDSIWEEAFGSKEGLDSTVGRAVDAVEQYQLCQKEYDENTIATEVISRFAVSGVSIPVVWMLLKTLPERTAVTKHNTFMLESYLNQGLADGYYDSKYLCCRKVVKRWERTYRKRKQYGNLMATMGNGYDHVGDEQRNYTEMQPVTFNITNCNIGTVNGDNYGQVNGGVDSVVKGDDVTKTQMDNEVVNVGINGEVHETSEIHSDEDTDDGSPAVQRDADCSEELNYEAPRLNLQALLKKPWFEEVRSDEAFGEVWTDAFVEALMASEYGELIAREWNNGGKLGKCSQIKGYVLGLLADEGVLKGSYNSIAGMVDLMEKPRTFARYMGEGKKQLYALWVKEYVDTH